MKKIILLLIFLSALTFKVSQRVSIEFYDSDCWVKKWDPATQSWYWYNTCEGWSIPPPNT